MFEDVLRFWLDRGVDGFRVDVAHGLLKEASLRDQVVAEGEEPGSGVDARRGSMVERARRDEPMWDQPEVHEVYRRWHQVLAEYPGDRMAVAEAWTQTPESMARFVRADEMQPGVQLLLAARAVVGGGVRRASSRSTLEALAEVDAAPTWVLSNHDVVRHATRYGGGAGRPRPGPRGDAGDAGAARARRTSTRARSSASRRSTSPPEHRQDPAWLPHRRPRLARRLPGADPVVGRRAAVRLRPGRPASRGSPSRPTGPTATVEAQEQDPDSTLAFYTAALAARRKHASDATEDVELLDAGADVLAFTPRRADRRAQRRQRRRSSCPAGDVRGRERGARGPAAARRTLRSGSGRLTVSR